MINFRVKDRKALLEKLKDEEVEIIGEVMEEEYGKFAGYLIPKETK